MSNQGRFAFMRNIIGNDKPPQRKQEFRDMDYKQSKVDETISMAFTKHSAPPVNFMRPQKYNEIVKSTLKIVGHEHFLFLTNKGEYFIGDRTEHSTSEWSQEHDKCIPLINGIIRREFIGPQGEGFFEVDYMNGKLEFGGYGTMKIFTRRYNWYIPETSIVLEAWGIERKNVLSENGFVLISDTDPYTKNFNQTMGFGRIPSLLFELSKENPCVKTVKYLLNHDSLVTDMVSYINHIIGNTNEIENFFKYISRLHFTKSAEIMKAILEYHSIRDLPVKVSGIYKKLIQSTISKFSKLPRFYDEIKTLKLLMCSSYFGTEDANVIMRCPTTYSINDICVKYNQDRKSTVINMKIENGILLMSPHLLFAFVMMIRGMELVRFSPEYKPTPKSQNLQRFINIVGRVPMEIAVILCNLGAGYKNTYSTILRGDDADVICEAKCILKALQQHDSEK